MIIGNNDTGRVKYYNCISRLHCAQFFCCARQLACFIESWAIWKQSYSSLLTSWTYPDRPKFFIDTVAMSRLPVSFGCATSFWWSFLNTFSCDKCLKNPREFTITIPLSCNIGKFFRHVFHIYFFIVIEWCDIYLLSLASILEEVSENRAPENSLTDSIHSPLSNDLLHDGEEDMCENHTPANAADVLDDWDTITTNGPLSEEKLAKNRVDKSTTGSSSSSSNRSSKDSRPLCTHVVHCPYFPVVS